MARTQGSKDLKQAQKLQIVHRLAEDSVVGKLSRGEIFRVAGALGLDRFIVRRFWVARGSVLDSSRKPATTRGRRPIYMSE